MIKNVKYLTCIIVLSIFQGYSQDIFYDQNIHDITFDNGKVYLSKHKSINDEIVVEKKNITNMSILFSLTIHSDFHMRYAWIYNNVGFDSFYQIDNNILITDLPEGTYSLLVGYEPSLNQHTIIFKDSISVVMATNLDISEHEAINTTKFELKREDLSPLRINTFYLYLFNDIVDNGLRISHENIDTSAFILTYNKIPQYCISEWAIKGKQLANNGNIYLLNNSLIDFQRDTTFTNDVTDFASAYFTYHLPDSIEENSEIGIMTFLPTTHANGVFDPDYRIPFTLNVFQDTTADISLKTSLFFQGINSNLLPYGFIYTSELRLGNGNVVGYHFQERDAPPFVISDTKNVQIGLTPTFWFGKFLNKQDTIKIRSSYGRFQFLFLSQSNDALRHYPHYYQILKDDSFFVDGFFNLWFGAPGLRVGFNEDELTIPVPTGKYEIEVTDDQNEVASMIGSSNVKANFDLTKEDKNPPNITLFQILADNELTNILHSINVNKVRFSLEDNVEINKVQLFYSSMKDTSWIELPIIFNEPYWETNIPELQNGYYTLKLNASDNDQNSIECIQEPAFHYGEITSILENNAKSVNNKFRLYQNYPNPFNSSTIIPFSIPDQYRGMIEISIYNILGEKVKSFTLLSNEISSHKLLWDGKDLHNCNLPSGIYIAKMKGGNIIKSSKLLLIK